MPFRHVYAFLFVTAILAPTFLFSQGPGGGDAGKGGGGFRMTIDPEKMWGWIAKDKDSINLDEMDSRSRGMVENVLTKYGVTSRTVTKAQYVEAYGKFNEDMKSGKIDMKSMFTRKEGDSGSGSKGSGEFGKGGGEFGKGGKDERTGGGKDEKKSEEKRAEEKKNDRARFIEWRFKNYDKDGDGLLSHDEITASENLAPLLADKAKFDKNGDGFVSLEEYTVYAEAVIEAKQKEREQMAENGGGDKPKEGSTDKAAGTEFEKPKMEEEKRATVQRSGKLPSGLPEWFGVIDGKGDADGQIGLYEWRAHSGKTLDEFTSMDLNNDGFITPSEYFRFKGIADTTVVRGKPLEDPSLAKGMGMGGFTRIGMGGGFGMGMGGTASMGMGNGWGFGGGMGMGMGDRPSKGSGFGGFGKGREMGMGMGTPPMGMSGGTMGMGSGMGMGDRPSKGKGLFGGFGMGMGMGTPPMGMGTPPGMGTMGMGSGMGDRPSKKGRN